VTSRVRFGLPRESLDRLLKRCRSLKPRSRNTVNVIKPCFGLLAPSAEQLQIFVSTLVETDSHL
jgi:hypothetical protein